MSSHVYADRAVLGTPTDTVAPDAPLRLFGLAAFTPGTDVRLGLTPAGNVRAGALGAAEIPSVFTRRDVNETINAWWMFSAGNVLAFDAGTLQAPQASARSTGTRIIVEAVPGAAEYAIGRETAGLWTSVPTGKEHAWYTSSVRRLRLASDGAFYVENGSGYLVLAGTGGTGTVYAPGALGIIGGGAGSSGYISLYTDSGLIQPVVNYRENLGNVARKFLSLHAAELWVETLVAQQTLATIGGRILVGPTTTLTRDVAPGDTTIYTKHNSLKLHVGGVEYGSKLLLESAGKLEVMAVTNMTTPTATASGDYAWTVIRAWGGSAWQWYAGDACFDTGKFTAPAGAFIDLYSVQGVNAGSSAGPTIIGNVRTGPLAFDWLEHWAIGNLKGIFNNGGSNVFGAAFGRPDQVHLQIDATNGIRMLSGGNTTPYGQWRLNGDLILGDPTKASLSFIASDGTLNMQQNGAYTFQLNAGTMYLHTGLVLGAAPSTTPYIRSNLASAWNAGSGFYFDFVQSTGAAHALIGNSAGRRVQWDGASLKIISDGFTLDESGIVLAQATSAYEPGKSIFWGTPGAAKTQMWDNTATTAAGPGSFWLTRANGALNIETQSVGGITSIGAGTDADRVKLQFQAVFGGPSQMILGGNVFGGGRLPRFVPAFDQTQDFGADTKRWLYSYVTYMLCNGVKCGDYTGAMPYQVQLTADLAAKPTSSTWTVVSDRRAKTDIRPVAGAAALELVRRVPLVRARTTGALGTERDAEIIGVIAQDVAELMPASVRDVEGTFTFNAHELFCLNVAAVQELAARVEALEKGAA